MSDSRENIREKSNTSNGISCTVPFESERRRTITVPSDQDTTLSGLVINKIVDAIDGCNMINKTSSSREQISTFGALTNYAARPINHQRMV